jgi:hypothetical protein
MIHVFQAIQLLLPRGSGSFMIDAPTRVSTHVIVIASLGYWFHIPWSIDCSLSIPS